MELDVSALVKAGGILWCAPQRWWWGDDRGSHPGSEPAFTQEAGLLWHFDSICLGVWVRFSKKWGFQKETMIALGFSSPGAGGGMQAGDYAGTGSDKMIIKVWMLHPCLSLYSS